MVRSPTGRPRALQDAFSDLEIDFGQAERFSEIRQVLSEERDGMPNGLEVSNDGSEDLAVGIGFRHGNPDVRSDTEREPGGSAFPFHSRLRHFSSSRSLFPLEPNRVRLLQTGWFSFGCFPPHLTMTQLPSNTGRRTFAR